MNFRKIYLEKNKAKKDFHPYTKRKDQKNAHHDYVGN
jgi:hypothetical protein